MGGGRIALWKRDQQGAFLVQDLGGERLVPANDSDDVLGRPLCVDRTVAEQEQQAAGGLSSYSKAKQIHQPPPFSGTGLS